MIQAFTIRRYPASERATSSFSAGMFALARHRAAVSFAFLFIAAVSVAAYVASVNVMLVQGMSARETERLIAAYEQETLQLRERAVRQASPSWLAEVAKNAGLVESSNVRYLSDDVAMAYAPLR